MNKKIVLAATLAGGLVAGAHVSATEAYANTTIKATTTANLNFRQGPGTNFGKFGVLPKGTSFNIVDSVPVNGFYKAVAEIGGVNKIGYVSKNYVSIGKTTASVNSKATHTVTANRVNVRSGAGTSFSVISQVNKGDKVEVTSSRTRLQNGIEWSSVKINGRNAYIATQYLKAITSTQTTAKPETTVKPETSVKPEVNVQLGTDAYEGTLVEGLNGFHHAHSDKCVDDNIHLGNQPYIELKYDGYTMLYADGCNEVNKLGSIEPGDVVRVYHNVTFLHENNDSMVKVVVEKKAADGTVVEIEGQIKCFALPSNTGNALIDFLRTR